MAEFKNNQITNDTNDEHALRVNMCVAGMTAHPEVAFRGTLVADVTAHRDTWEALDSQHADEWGDEQAATAFTKKCEDELDEKLTAARFMVESMLAEEEVIGVTEFDIRRDFGVEVAKPRTRAGMLALGKKMVATNARYVLALSPYALPEPFFADLAVKVATLQTAIDTHAKELDERLSVGEAVRVQRAKGDKLLKQAFDWLCALLGDDDYLLLEFGFVPKSQIWTPGSGEPEPGGGKTPWGMVQGLEVSIDPIGNIYIKWKKVATAEKYTLLREVVPIGSMPPVLPYSVYMTGIPPFEEFVAFGDTDHDPGFAYYYSVIAVNALGEETEACPPKGIEMV